MIYLGMKSEYDAAKSYVSTLIRLAMDQIREAREHPAYYDQCKAEFRRLLQIARAYTTAINDYEARHG